MTVMWQSLLAITGLSSNTFAHVAARTLSLSHPHIGRDALLNNASDVPNLSLSNANFTSLNDTQFLCSGEEYGWDLQLHSCIGALEHQMIHYPYPLSFGHRGSQGSFDIQLPARLTGGTAFPLNSRFHYSSRAVSQLGLD